MSTPHNRHRLIDSIKEAGKNRKEDLEILFLEKLNSLKEELVIAVRKQISLMRENNLHDSYIKVEKLEDYYSLISTKKGFLDQIDIPPGNLTYLPEEILDIRKKCTDIAAEKSVLYSLLKEHNALIYETAHLYASEENEFYSLDDPIDVDLKTKERIKMLKDSIPEDLRNTLNYYFVDLIETIRIIADKIRKKGYFYLVDNDNCSAEFLIDMSALSVKLRFAEGVDRGISSQHLEYDNLNINDTSDLSDEEIDGYFGLIEVEDENNLTLFEAEEIACMYERIRLSAILEGVMGDDQIEQLQTKVLMLIKGVMHHLYALNHEMIADEIDDIKNAPQAKERKNHSLLHVNLIFNQLFRMIREGNNLRAALSIVK